MTGEGRRQKEIGEEERDRRQKTGRERRRLSFSLDRSRQEETEAWCEKEDRGIGRGLG